jgi:6-phosphogluconate dehydrogenase
MMKRPNMALIGLGVMGSMLSKNFAEKGYDIAVYNRTSKKTDELYAAVKNERFGKKIYPVKGELKDLVKEVGKKGIYFIIVKAGDATNSVAEKLLNLLEPGAVIVDLANSNFHDTIELEKKCSEKNIDFFGVGISGGEEGARNGPSIMAGGNKKTYDKKLKKIFEDISAKARQDNLPCALLCGKNGAGHFVKMVHNGIEYADMQLIAEAYDLMKNILNLDSGQISKIFSRWNKGILKSYLIDITSEVLSHKDLKKKSYLVDNILDKAKMKGTGTWTIMSSLELEDAVYIPSIYAAVGSRAISNNKEKRKQMSSLIKLKKPIFKGDKNSLVKDLEKAMYLGKIAAYSQGFDLIKAASEEYDFGQIDISKVAKIWRAGCIIRADFLDDIAKAYNNKLISLLAYKNFKETIQKNFVSLNNTCKTAADHYIPLLAFESSRSYILQCFSENLPANLIQGMRDYFGSHNYERKDKKGVFHTNWSTDKKEIEIK